MAEAFGQQEQSSIFQDWITTLIDRSEPDRRIGQLAARFTVIDEQDEFVPVGKTIRTGNPEALNWFPAKRAKTEKLLMSVQLVLDDKRGANLYENDGQPRRDERGIQKNLSTPVVIVNDDRREQHRGDLHDMMTIRSTTGKGDYRVMLDIRGDSSAKAGGFDDEAGDGVRAQATGPGTTQRQEGGSPTPASQEATRIRAKQQAATNTKHSTGWLFDGRNIGNLATIIVLNPEDKVGNAKDGELIIPVGLQAFFHYEADFGHGPIHLLPGDADLIPEGDGELVKGFLQFDSSVATGSEYGRIRPIIRVPRPASGETARGPVPTPEGQPQVGGTRSRPKTGDIRREEEPSKPKEDPRGSNPDPRPTSGGPVQGGGPTPPPPTTNPPSTSEEKDPKKGNQERNLRGADTAGTAAATSGTGLGTNEDADGDAIKPVTGQGTPPGEAVVQEPTINDFEDTDSAPATGTGTTPGSTTATAFTTNDTGVSEHVGRGAECCLHENWPVADPKDGGSVDIKVPKCPGEDKLKSLCDRIQDAIDKLQDDHDSRLERVRDALGLNPSAPVNSSGAKGGSKNKQRGNLADRAKQSLGALEESSRKFGKAMDDVEKNSLGIERLKEEAKAEENASDRKSKENRIKDLEKSNEANKKDLKKLERENNKSARKARTDERRVERKEKKAKTERGVRNLKKQIDKGNKAKNKVKKKLRRLKEKWKKKALKGKKGDEPQPTAGGEVAADDLKPICTQPVSTEYEITEDFETKGSPPTEVEIDGSDILHILNEDGSLGEVPVRMLSLPTLGEVPVGTEAMSRAKKMRDKGILSEDAFKIINGRSSEILSGDALSFAQTDAERVYKSKKLAVRETVDQVSFLTSKMSAMYYQMDGLMGGVFRDFFSGNLTAIAHNSINLPVLGHTFGQSVRAEDVRNRPAVNLFGDITTRPGDSAVTADGPVVQISINDIGNGGLITDNRALLRLTVGAQGNVLYRGNLLEAGRTRIDWTGRLDLGAFTDVESFLVTAANTHVSASFRPVTSGAVTLWLGTGGQTLLESQLISDFIGNFSGMSSLSFDSNGVRPGALTAAGSGLWMDGVVPPNFFFYDGVSDINLTDKVEGPGVSTDTAIARFSGITGKIIQNSGILISGADVLTTPAQIVSTLAAGTPPLVVASNDLVINLNADLLDGLEASAFALAAHTHPASDIVSGQIALARGGTNADLSATGGANQVVQQSGVGAAFTVGQLAHNQLSGLGADDHTIYALLAGRAGGQTLIGGSAINEDLTLRSNSTATPGNINANDPIEYVDTDATPVANRRITVIDGVIIATDTSNVEGRFISNLSIELIDLTGDVTGVLPIANGGTNGATAQAGFDNLSPVTTLGDIIYGDAVVNNVRLAGNITTAKQFLTQTGTGAVSAAPAWGAIVLGDLPSGIILADGSVPLTADWDVGAFTVTMLRLVSDQATGVAPFTVASTTVVTNLNADQLDGNDASAFALASHVHSAADITTGTLVVARGGTGADLSATGGANQVVQQVGVGSAFTVAQLAHDQLAGLTDDDHSIYALLAGRSGGQTLVGGDGVSEDLTLSSNSTGTPGNINASDPIEYVDTDATPVANRRVTVIDGVIISTDTSNVEGRFISRDSLQSVEVLRTSTGPTDLTIGAVADGEFLIRSGGTIIGSAGSGGGNTLTEAYNEGGAGAGRTMIILSGSFQLTATQTIGTIQDINSVAVASGTVIGLDIDLSGMTGGANIVDGLIINLPMDGAGARRSIIGDSFAIFRDGDMVIGSTSMSSTERFRVAGGTARFEDLVDVQGDLLLRDQDVSFVADRHIRVIDGRILATTTGNVEGRFISNDSIEVMDIADGGTGQTTQTAAMDALSPTTTEGDLLVDDGTNVIRLAVGANDEVLTADSAEASGIKWAASIGQGKIVQVLFDFDTVDRSTTNTIPDDDIAPGPQTTEMAASGAAITYTPTSASTITYVFAIAHVGNSGGAIIAAGLHRTGTNMESMGRSATPNSANMDSIPIDERFAHGSTASQTWTVYFGGTPGTTFLNRPGVGARYSNRLKTTIIILEVDES